MWEQRNRNTVLTLVPLIQVKFGMFKRAKQIKEGKVYL